MTDTNSTDKAKKIYFDVIEYLQSTKERVAVKSSFDVDPAVHLIEQIVDEPGLIQKIFPLSIKTFHADDYMIPHQANVMIYVLKIGIALKYSRTQLIELGLSALLHDVGMFMLPKDIIGKAGKLTPSEIDVMRLHAEYGRDILSPFEEKYPFLLEVVYQHHERADGSGYPRALDDKEINEYAKILCMMDCYEAMIHNRPDRKALNQTFSAKELVIETKQTGFPPKIIKTFLDEITLYPEGSYVRLNNKRICEVVAVSHSNPLKPDVKTCFDQLGNRVEGEQIIKLRETPIFFIEECISLEDLPKH
jgi:HD-GYP domain-containing protein (c-di-GMP phosphodiesterase class II)